MAGVAVLAATVALAAGCGEDEAPEAATTAAPPPPASVEDLAGEAQVEIIQGSTPVVAPGLDELQGIPGQAVPPGAEEGGEVEDNIGRFRRRAPEPAGFLDPVLDRGPLEESLLPGPEAAFEGIAFGTFLTWGAPPDAVGDAGPDHYLEWVNTGLQVFSRDGEPLLSAPVAGNVLFSALGADHPCAAFNNGDPVVAYDQLAGRWVLTQFAFPFDTGGNPTGPSYSCVAVSETSDPFQEWCVGVHKYSDVDFFDYPKLGVWGNSYLLTANTWRDDLIVSQLVMIEREPLLSCERPARAAVFVDESLTYWLPADADGPLPPGQDEGALFFGLDDDGWYRTPEGPDALLVYELHPDFEAGTVEGTRWQLPVAPFDSNLCGFRRDCVPVPEPGEALDPIAGILMNRGAFRRFEGYDAVALAHTVDVDGQDRLGIRWYELRRAGGEWQIADQGTFAPDDGDSRWLPSAAMDAAGNLAVAYAVAGAETFPSVRYAARRPTDPPGKLALGEGTLVEGGGVQTDGGHRWGDYGALTLDPLDDCLFWYTGEYYPATAEVGWATRIVTFRLPGCPAEAGGGAETGSVEVPPETGEAELPPAETGGPPESP